MKIFGIRDIKSATFGNNPMAFSNIPEACRELSFAVRDNTSKTNKLNAFAADYELWQLAEFNQETGEFINTPHMVCSMVALKEEA